MIIIFIFALSIHFYWKIEIIGYTMTQFKILNMSFEWTFRR